MNSLGLKMFSQYSQVIPLAIIQFELLDLLVLFSSWNLVFSKLWGGIEDNGDLLVDLFLCIMLESSRLEREVLILKESCMYSNFSGVLRVLRLLWDQSETVGLDL